MKKSLQNLKFINLTDKTIEIYSHRTQKNQEVEAAYNNLIY